MYISCSSVVEANLHLSDAILRMKELGYRYFDFFAFDGCCGLSLPKLVAGDDSIVRELSEVISRTGLKVSSFNCGFSRHVNDPDPAARQQVEKEYLALLELAGKVNCPGLTVQAGVVPEGGSFTEAYEGALEGLLRLHSLGKLGDGTLSFEPHQGAVVEKPADALRMAQALWPKVGITYDPSHFAMQEIPLPQTEAMLEYTVHVHVRDAGPGRMQVPMGEGTVDFAWLIRALEERNYQGPVAIEYLDAKEEDATKLRDVLVELGVQL